MNKLTKKTPLGVEHQPTAMAWAQLTPTSEIKKLEENGAIEITEEMTHDPMPVSKATTLLRRAYPYVFDCAAYLLSRAPELIREDNFYKYFEMSTEVFFEYCLDDCHEQKNYLEKELYEILLGEKPKAKYIKVSKDRTVLAQPVIIAFSHTDLKTGKEERIKNLKNIGQDKKQDKKIDTVHVQIIKELMTYENGYLNVPKAFYAKTRRVFETMRKNVQPLIDNKNDYWSLINSVKSMATEPIKTPEAARAAEIILAQSNVLLDIEQGGFHKVYLALEYILVKRSRGIKKQVYNLLELCSKCAPEYTQEIDGNLYYKDKKSAFRFGLILSKMVNMFDPKNRDIIGIEHIDVPKKGDALEVVFLKWGNK